MVSIDETELERKTSGKTATAINLVRERLVAVGKIQPDAPKNTVDGDYQRGAVWARINGRAQRIFDKDPDSSVIEFRLVPGYDPSLVL